jgi:hypothetical protein
VPTTSAGLPRLLFLLRPLTVLMKQTRQAVRAIKQSILLRILWIAATVYVVVVINVVVVVVVAAAVIVDAPDVAIAITVYVVVVVVVVATIATSNNNSYPASTKQTINNRISRSKVINTFAVIYTCEEYCAVFNNVRSWLMKSWDTCIQREPLEISK